MFKSQKQLQQRNSYNEHLRVQMQRSNAIILDEIQTQSKRLDDIEALLCDIREQQDKILYKYAVDDNSEMIDL